MNKYDKRYRKKKIPENFVFTRGFSRADIFVDLPKIKFSDRKKKKWKVKEIERSDNDKVL